MRMTKMIAAVAALALTSTPVLAQAAPANPAAKLSLSPKVRASSNSKGSNALADGPSTLTAVILLGLVAAGIVAATTGGDDRPDSA